MCVARAVDDRCVGRSFGRGVTRSAGAGIAKTRHGRRPRAYAPARNGRGDARSDGVSCASRPPRNRCTRRTSGDRSRSASIENATGNRIVYKPGHRAATDDTISYSPVSLRATLSVTVGTGSLSTGKASARFVATVRTIKTAGEQRKTAQRIARDRFSPSPIGPWSPTLFTHPSHNVAVPGRWNANINFHKNRNCCARSDWSSIVSQQRVRTIPCCWVRGYGKLTDVGQCFSNIFTTWSTQSLLI